MGRISSSLIELPPQSAAHWNALGVAAMAAGEDFFGLAQHSFIRSAECENNSLAWTNLGVLYLISGEEQLANAAFKESQGGISLAFSHLSRGFAS